MGTASVADITAPVLIACHDAGAANIILSLAAVAHWLPHASPVMAGPAAALWRRRFPDRRATDFLPLALTGVATVLTGTGWQSRLEHDARRLARAAGIRSIAVIDHWTNYPARFRFEDEEVLPDEIWVTDQDARALAVANFPDIPVMLHHNLYLAEQAAQVGPVPSDGDLLFVAEPARDEWGKGVAGEFQALDYLSECRHQAGIAADATLRIRSHPSELPGKYDAWIAAHPGSELDRSPDMAAALRSARWVAGLQSFGLVIALAAGRQVVSALPPHAPHCALPHAGIVHLRTLPGPS